MSDKPTNDGGPAFPIPNGINGEAPGMSLRDYFAAHAPADAYLYAPKDWKFEEPFTSHDRSDHIAWEFRQSAARAVAGRWAYADAMLKARSQ